jgi:hypothetical protein
MGIAASRSDDRSTGATKTDISRFARELVAACTDGDGSGAKIMVICSNKSGATTAARALERAMRVGLGEIRSIECHQVKYHDHDATAAKLNTHIERGCSGVSPVCVFLDISPTVVAAVNTRTAFVIDRDVAKTVYHMIYQYLTDSGRSEQRAAFNDKWGAKLLTDPECIQSSGNSEAPLYTPDDFEKARKFITLYTADTYHFVDTVGKEQLVWDVEDPPATLISSANAKMELLPEKNRQGTYGFLRFYQLQGNNYAIKFARGDIRKPAHTDGDGNEHKAIMYDFNYDFVNEINIAKWVGEMYEKHQLKFIPFLPMSKLFIRKKETIDVDAYKLRALIAYAGEADALEHMTQPKPSADRYNDCHKIMHSSTLSQQMLWNEKQSMLFDVKRENMVVMNVTPHQIEHATTRFYTIDLGGVLKIATWNHRPGMLISTYIPHGLSRSISDNLESEAILYEPWAICRKQIRLLTDVQFARLCVYYVFGCTVVLYISCMFPLKAEPYKFTNVASTLRGVFDDRDDSVDNDDTPVIEIRSCGDKEMSKYTGLELLKPADNTWKNGGGLASMCALTLNEPTELNSSPVAAAKFNSFLSVIVQFDEWIVASVKKGESESTTDVMAKYSEFLCATLEIFDTPDDPTTSAVVVGTEGEDAVAMEMDTSTKASPEKYNEPTTSVVGIEGENATAMELDTPTEVDSPEQDDDSTATYNPNSDDTEDDTP